MTIANDLTTGLSVLLALVLAVLPGAGAVETALGVAVVVGIATAWPRLGRGVRIGAAGSLLAGAVLGVVTGATVRDMTAGFAQMAIVFGFFALVRLLEVPILTGRFHHALVRFFADRLRIRNRAVAGTMVTYGLTSGLSIGAVPIAYRFGEALWAGSDVAVPARDGAAAGVSGRAAAGSPEPEVPARAGTPVVQARPARDDNAGLGRVVTQGFTAANAWTPVSPIVALALQTTGAPMLAVLAWAVPMSLVAAGATAWLRRSSGDLRLDLVPPARRGAVEFAMAIVVLVILIATLDRAWGITPIGASMLSILLVVTGWQLTLERPAAAGRSIWTALRGHRGAWPEQFTLFCAGGMLVGAARAFSRGGVGGVAVLSGLALVIVVPAVIVLLSVLSFYPMVTLAALGTLLGANAATGTTTPLALALILGASIGFLVSPFTGLTLLVSSMSRRSTMAVAVGWNLTYGLGFLVLGTALVAVAYWAR